MRNSLLVIAAAVGALAATSCVADGAQLAPPAGKSAGRACFHANQVRNFSAPDEDRVYVRAGTKDVFELELLGPCPNLDWTHRLGLRSRGSNFVCAGVDLDLIVPQEAGMRPLTCPVRAVRKLTEEEVAKLKDKP